MSLVEVTTGVVSASASKSRHGHWVSDYRGFESSRCARGRYLSPVHLDFFFKSSQLEDFDVEVLLHPLVLVEEHLVLLGHVVVLCLFLPQGIFVLSELILVVALGFLQLDSEHLAALLVLEALGLQPLGFIDQEPVLSLELGQEHSLSHHRLVGAIKVQRYVRQVGQVLLVVRVLGVH